MFEVHRITIYGEGNIGRAIIVRNDGNDVSKVIEFIFMVNANNNWFFHYKNGTHLTDEERIDLENWFITCR